MSNCNLDNLSQAAQSGSQYVLAPLPYADNALEPVISAHTLSFHYGKHHKTYVDNLNNLLANSDLAGQSLEQIIKATAGQADKAAIFNNAAQVWNHMFYWHSLKPNGGGEPSAALKQKIETSFGSLDACKKEFAQAAMTQFGSGWAWLVLDGDKIAVAKTGNAETPITKNVRPLLTIDVWEHAYYLKHQNKRADYIKDWWNVVNWEKAQQLFEQK